MKWKVMINGGRALEIEADKACAFDHNGRDCMVLYKGNQTVFLVPLENLLYAICLTEEGKSIRKKIDRPDINGISIDGLHIVLDEDLVYIIDDQSKVNVSFPASAATVNAGGDFE